MGMGKRMEATAGIQNGGVRRHCLPMESSSFNLCSILVFGSGLFVLATLFFGTKGGYYDTDAYDGNGTAH
jgi:hypothetical protein